MPVAFVPSTPAPTHPGRFRPSGAFIVPSDSGIPLLTTQFGPDARLIVEAAFGANLTADPDSWPWVDVTADIRHAGRLRMRVGRADDTSSGQSASCGFDLNNTTSAYSAYNPASVNYGNLRRNTPIRVRIDIGGGPSTVWQGYAVGFTPSWDTSAQLANVSVVAGGAMRRLGQGTKPLRSALYRTISVLSNLVAYWPLEDSSGASFASQAVAGQAVMEPGTTVPSFGSAGPDGAAAAVDVTNGGFLSAAVTGGLSTAWSVEFSMKLAASADPGAGALQRFVQIFTSGSESRWQLGHSISGGPSLLVYGPDGANDLFLNASGTQYDDTWHSYTITAAQSGANIAVTVYVDDVSVASGSISSATLGSIGRVTLPAATPNYLASGQGSVAHLVVYDGAIVPDHADAVSGWAGETASTRIARLCDEEGMQLALTGTSTMTMGGQPIASFLDILRECETVDGGVLFDGFGPGLGYICRTSRYNLPASVTIDVAAGQLSPPFAPADDDQRIRNDITVSRSGGSSARYVDESGPLGTAAVGIYDTSATVNTADDDPLLQIAAWLVGLATVEGLRYPNLTQDFAAVPALAQSWINATGPAFRADVVNIDAEATQHPPDDVSLVVEGWSMNLDQIGWDLTASCSQYAPWRVAVFDSALYDSATSTLTTAAPAGSLSLTVSVADGVLWKTGAVSFDINAGGVRFPVTNISGTGPQVFTVGAPVNGVVKDLPAGTQVRLWNTPTYAL